SARAGRLVRGLAPSGQGRLARGVTGLSALRVLLPALLLGVAVALLLGSLRALVLLLHLVVAVQPAFPPRRQAAWRLPVPAFNRRSHAADEMEQEARAPVRTHQEERAEA